MAAYHHRIGTRDKAIERHNPGSTAGYPFLGEYKVDKELAHGHGPRPPNMTYPSYMCMRISGSNIVVDEISITGNETIQCAIGEINAKQPILPQQRALSQFQFTGQRLSFPDNAHAYCLSTHVKNLKTSAVHHMQLVVRGSDDGQASRPGTPRNAPRDDTKLIDNDGSGTGGAGPHFLKITSDSNLDHALNIACDGNPPMLLPAGSSISVAAKRELLLLPSGDPNHDAILAQKSIILKTAPSANAPVGIQVGNVNLLARANGAGEVKISALDAVKNPIVIQPSILPQLDYSFDLSPDNEMTVVSATASYNQQQQQQQLSALANDQWKIILTVPSLGLKSENISSAMLQFCAAAQSVEVHVAVWSVSAYAADQSSSALLTQKIKIPVLNPRAGSGGANQSNSLNQQQAPLVSIRAKDSADGSERKIEATCPPELAATVSLDGNNWYPGVPGISIRDPLQNPIAHVSLVDRANQKKLTQLALDLPNAMSNKLSEWIPQLTAGLNSGVLDNNNNNNNNNNDGGAGNDGGIAKLFDGLTPPSNAPEKNLLFALQDTFGKLLKKRGLAPYPAPRFSVTYSPPMTEGETGRFENVRCENAASLALQTGGPDSYPLVIAPGTSVSAPKQGDPFPAVILASDANGRLITALELREDASVYSANAGNRSKGINNNNGNNNGGNNVFGNSLCFNLGNDPNTLTGFYCANATRVQAGIGGENALPADVDFRTIVSVAGGQKALIRAIDSQGSIISQAIVEGSKTQGSKSLGELWTQMEQAVSGNPEASNLRTLKPGSDPWLDELVRVIRGLCDPKRTFEIRFRGASSDETATVDCAGNRFANVSEANPAKVLICDRVATVIPDNNGPNKNQKSGNTNEVSDGLVRCIAEAGDAEGLRNSLSRLRPSTNTDERIQDGLLHVLNKLKNQQQTARPNPIRFALPRGSALRNLRCDKPDVVLFATLNNGRRERLTSGETMPPSALQNSTDTMEIEAVVQNLADNTTTTLSSVVISFTSDDKNTAGSSGKDGCIGFDCEILPDGEQAVINLTAPDGYQIHPRVDGLKGNSLGSRGLVRVDPFSSHVIQITLEDSVGRSVLKQNLFFPRIALPKCDIALDNSAVGVQCPRGMRVLAAVDGGPEKTTDMALPFDGDRPHVIGLKFLGDNLCRDGSREMCRIGELTFKIPPQFSPADILELLRLLKEHDPTNPGSSSSAHLPPRLSQLAATTRSNTVRDMACIIAALCGRGASTPMMFAAPPSQQFQPPLAPAYNNNNNTSNTTTTGLIRPQPVVLQKSGVNSQVGSRSQTPRDAIQFRLSGDGGNDDHNNMDGALP